ncbi:UNVERIFIED_ORG: DNA-binding HxlR family transcriptional regulator [Sphingomonas sp. R1F5B]
MRSKSFDGMACSIAEVMGAVGDRWGLLIMRDVLLGLTRYDDLRRSTGATNATLSDRLKSLEEAGLIEKRLYQARPPRHDYVPTLRGQDLALLLQAMVQIGDTWRRRAGQEAPLRIEQATSGRPVQLVLADAETGMPTGATPLRVAPGPGADEAMQWRLAMGAEARAMRVAPEGQAGGDLL